MSGPGGVHVAAVTPFDAELGVDVDAYLHHLRWLAGHGVDGIVLFGTNGEGPSLSLGEKAALLERVASAELGVSLLPTVAEGNLPDTLELVARCNDLPATAVLVLPPYFFKPVDPAGVEDFYRRVLAVARHPLLAYHVPKYAVPVPAEVVTRLPVWGVKDSAAEPGYLDAVLAGDRAVLLGTESGVVERLGLGAQGMVSALANVVPDLVVTLYRAVRAGDRASADELERRLLELRKRTKEYASPGVLKRMAAARHGAAMGTVRPPLVPVPEDYDPLPALHAAGVDA